MVHTALRHGLSQLAEYAARPALSPSILPSVLGYALSLLSGLSMHHHHEDEIVFPALDPHFPNGEIKGFAKDHERLEPLLARIEAFCESALKATSSFDQSAFAALIRELRDIVEPHLVAEERAMAPDAMRHIPPAVLTNILRRIEGY